MLFMIGDSPRSMLKAFGLCSNKKSDDYVVATGVVATVRELCEASFCAVGLNHEDYVETEARYTRPTEVHALIGDPSKAQKIPGWKAKALWKEIAQIMVESDLKKFSK